MKENGFVAFYDKHKISPVSQDISDLDRHVSRRRKLYRMLGIDYRLFRGAEILEVGAGSGHNTLFFLLIGARVDIVEPNRTGREQMKKLFNEHNINPDQYMIYDCLIEEFEIIKQYDFVIAEGFLSGLQPEEQERIVLKLLDLTKKFGYCVVTTMSECSFFFERLRRFLGCILVRDVTDFSEKVNLLALAFKSHLNTLKYASRTIEDWVADNILNPVGDEVLFNIKRCIEMVCRRGDMEVVGMSPSIIPNFGWYKDYDYCYFREILRAIPEKEHLLLSVGMKDVIRSADKNEILLRDIHKIRLLARELRGGGGDLYEIVVRFRLILRHILEENRDLEDILYLPIKEYIDVLDKVLAGIKITPKFVAAMPYFSRMWGRGQQYISFIKGI